MDERQSSMMSDSFETRHTLSFKKDRGMTESSEYLGITEAGVELAREKAKIILKHIKEKPAGTIFFLSGSSELARSKSTLRVYGDELKKLVDEEGVDDVYVISEDDVIRSGEGFGERTRAIVEEIKAQGNNKIAIVSPLSMTGFGVKGVWSDGEGNMDYYNELQKICGNNDDKAIRYWLENFKSEGGVLQVDGKTVLGPDPKVVAESQIESIRRLRDFVAKHISNRNVEIGSVGHAFNLDALAVDLADNGEMAPETFDQIGGMIGETEMLSISADDEDTATFSYGDRFQKTINVGEKESIN